MWEWSIHEGINAPVCFFMFITAYHSQRELESMQLYSSAIIINSSIKSVQNVNWTKKTKQVRGRYWDKEASCQKIRTLLFDFVIENKGWPELGSPLELMGLSGSLSHL